jgi:charged multivesicular body protein 5
MFRLFGKEKPKAPTITLDDASAGIEKRSGEVEAKIKKLDDELRKYQVQMSKMKPGPAKTAIQKRALGVLKQKKMYEKSKDQMMNQQFNIDQTRFTTDNLKDTVNTVAAMKAAGAALKEQFKEIDIDEIEDLHDDMSEMMELNDEVSEVMGRAYGVPDSLDEEDLLNELESLEDEMAQEEAQQVPSYLISANSAAKSKEEQKNVVETDEFGLPKVPMRKLEA